MYVIYKEFSFSASHILSGLQEGHQCARLHGHNYKIVIELSSDVLDDVGFIVDFGEMRVVKEFLDSAWDHRHLNDCPPFSSGVNPTAENMAEYLAKVFRLRWPQLCAVRVSETPSSWAEYRFNDDD